MRIEPREDEPLRPGAFEPDEFEAGRTPAMPAASKLDQRADTWPWILRSPIGPWGAIKVSG